MPAAPNEGSLPTSSGPKAGVLFAIMTLGYNPVEMAVWRADPSLSKAPQDEQAVRAEWPVSEDLGRGSNMERTHGSQPAGG